MLVPIPRLRGRLGEAGAGGPASGVSGRVSEADTVLREWPGPPLLGLILLPVSQPRVASSARGVKGNHESDGDARGKDAISG